MEYAKLADIDLTVSRIGPGTRAIDKVIAEHVTDSAGPELMAPPVREETE